MASTLISDPKKWVGEISELLKDQLQIDVEIPPVSILQIPEIITAEKPEAYKPQQIGLGPYHHFQPESYAQMEQKKLGVVQLVLHRRKITDFQVVIVDVVQKLVPLIRACYQTLIHDVDKVSMAYVFAIDGLFLLRLFETYDRKETDHAKRSLAQDILMIENQLPYIVLKQVHEALQYDHTDFSPNSLFRSFCEMHSPLQLCTPSQAPARVEHLLEYLYYSIINNVEPGTSPSKSDSDAMLASAGFFSCIELFSSPTNSIFSIFNFLTKVPEKEIVQLYEKTIVTLQNFTKNKHTIPSCSKLQSIAGFKFQPIPVRGIYIEEDVIYLPWITLSNDSEVILRNLVAYEWFMADGSKNLPLKRYMGLMCGLIEDVEDVKILKRENIIQTSGLGDDDDVVKIFVGMSNSRLSLQKEEKSELQELIDEVIRVYESKPRVKVKLLLKKVANWVLVILRGVGGFVGATWKIVVFMISVVTVFMLTYKAYCDVYGCDHKTNLILSYASI